MPGGLGKLWVFGEINRVRKGSLTHLQFIALVELKKQ